MAYLRLQTPYFSEETIRVEQNCKTIIDSLHNIDLGNINCMLLYQIEPKETFITINPKLFARIDFYSDELYNDLQAYLSQHYTRGKTTRPVLNKTNTGLPEGLFKRFQEEVEELRKEHPNNLNNYIREVKGCNQKSANKTQNALNLCYAEKAALTPLKAIQMEGVLSRELFSEIVDFVSNNYEWPERLDGEIDRIILKYRTRGKVGRNKITVRKALYKAYALGV